MGRFADALIRRLDRARSWPLQREKAEHDKIRLWRAIRNNDREYLARYVDWGGDPKHYLIDPLGPKITQAYRDLLWGRPPGVEPADDGDAELLETLLKENGFDTGAELRRGEDIKSSEGQVWWRILADPDATEAPIVDWHSRLAVVPYWFGRKLVAVAFMSELDDLSDQDATIRGTIVYRHFEVHDAESVTNVLYEGTAGHLGRRVPLDSHGETEDLVEEWVHRVGMNAGWIPNTEGLDPRSGVSDYDGIEDMLLELNECLSTGRTNRKLTARKRVLVPPSAVNEHGEIDADQEAIVVDPDELGDGGNVSGAAWKVLEYSFDAEALIRYSNDVAIKALTRAGMAAQFVGVTTDDGYAPSGTSLRLRLIPAKNTGEGKGAGWDSELPTMVLQLQKVSALPEADGGYGWAWRNPDEAPKISRQFQLPEDPVERDQRLSQARTASIVSTEQAIRERHPEWDDDLVEKEVKAIRDDIDHERGSTGPSDGPPDAPSGGLPTIFDGKTPSAPGSADQADGGTQADLAEEDTAAA